MIECKCGKGLTLKRAYLIEAEPDCEGGLDHTASVREEIVIQLLDEEYEAHHQPGCYWHSPKEAWLPFSQENSNWLKGVSEAS